MNVHEHVLYVLHACINPEGGQTKHTHMHIIPHTHTVRQDLTAVALYMFVCVYIYIYIYIYIVSSSTYLHTYTNYIYIYIYPYTHKQTRVHRAKGTPRGTGKKRPTRCTGKSGCPGKNATFEYLLRWSCAPVVKRYKGLQQYFWCICAYLSEHFIPFYHVLILCARGTTV
jgi:hypothetical protein